MSYKKLKPITQETTSEVKDRIKGVEMGGGELSYNAHLLP